MIRLYFETSEHNASDYYRSPKWTDQGFGFKPEQIQLEIAQQKPTGFFSSQTNWLLINKNINC